MKRDTLYRAGAAGIGAVALGTVIGELSAVLFLPVASPFAVIGGALIDIAPSWAKDLAIGLFGTFDKMALLIGIALVLCVVAAVVGILELSRAGAGTTILGVLGVIGVVTAMTRAGAGVLSWVPAGLAAAIAVIALLAFIRPLRLAESGTSRSVRTSEGVADPASAGLDRRRFLLWAGGVTAVGMIALAAGNLARGASRSIEAVRKALRLPAAQAPAAPIPPGAELDIPGLAPLVTPNRDFYRIDTALVVPQVNPSDWSLRIHGMVDRELVITWDDLLALPMQEADVTLACVSNEVGGSLIGNARWLGHPIRDLLARAGVADDADMVLSTSADGFTASTPLEVLTDDRDALLAIGMNGEPLPVEHGFPVRMVVPGLYGYVSATKWVTQLEVTRFDRASAYWTTRGWDERGPIKLQSRIDVPREGRRIDPGDTVIAGMAWQQHVGIEGVEVRIDGGPWLAAELATAVSDDTWVQWSMPWTAESGSHEIECRAVSADGETQTSNRTPPAPNGAEGWHRISVSVG